MKLKFNPSLDYQNDAITSVVDLFKGQSPKQANFTVSKPTFNYGQGQLDIENHSGIGYGNRLELLPEEILSNLNEVQLRNKLPQSERLDGMHFSIEMETGTGKTYVYLKSIFELNKAYGFTKFIIVVPSVAIREGVKKSIEITEDHFGQIFDGVPVEAFVYDSGNLEQIRNFATTSHIQIMVINIDSFSTDVENVDEESKANIINRMQDKLGHRPIDLIKETNPIVIIDEPQNMETEIRKKAIASLNPLCTFRYSATHKNKYNEIYRLDAIDAYQRRLVKQIEVLSVQSEDSFNKPYIKLLSTKKNSASLEIDVDIGNGIKRKKVTVRNGDSLYDKSNEREMYREYLIEDISWESLNEYIITNGQALYLGEVIGDICDDEIKRVQIRQTIEEHLKKERRLNHQGIKVLSLFFIDKVANYREYDEEGNALSGKYARMFEAEYLRLINKPLYKNNMNKHFDVSEIHDGYFSVDKTGKKKGQIKDTRGNTKADEDTYSLIMRDKERLLDMDTPLRFIFSHSALREGWDNPNVFQICTLKESSGTYIRRRQEIGRGLRLAVNGEGERVYDENVNIVTVMANESYADFAKGLQKELEDDTGRKFGILMSSDFTNISYYDSEKEKNIYLGQENSRKLFDYLVENEYVDSNGNVQSKLEGEIKSGKVEIPEELYPWKSAIEEEISERLERLPIKDATKKKRVKLNKRVVESEDFVALWEKINQKTKYRLSFDSDELIRKCASKIRGMEKIFSPQIKIQKDRVALGRDEGVTGNMIISDFVSSYSVEPLPDILTELQNKTNLTRRTLIAILKESHRLEDFRTNPQIFINEVTKIIKSVMRTFLVDGIKYEKIEDFYCITTFKSESEEMLAYLNNRVLEAENDRFPFDYVVCDSDKELEFARKLEHREDVKVYIKLPSYFKIDTPLGSYNPDWAVVIEKDGVEKLYFVIETKGTNNIDELPPSEKGRIKCAIEHFKAIGTDVEYKVPIADADEFFKGVKA